MQEFFRLDLNFKSQTILEINKKEMKLISLIGKLIILSNLKQYKTNSIFEKIQNTQINEIGILSLQKSYITLSLIKCLSTCSIDEACVLAQFKSTTCYLFNVIQVQYFVQSDKSSLYKKRNNK